MAISHAGLAAYPSLSLEALTAKGERRSRPAQAPPPCTLHPAPCTLHPASEPATLILSVTPHPSPLTPYP